MIKSISMWVISLVAVLLFATQVGYRLLEREQSHRMVPSNSNLAEPVLVPSDVARTAGVAHDAGQAGRSQEIASERGLHQRILAMPEPERNQIFYLIIRDAGSKCTANNSQYVVADGAWLAHCGESQTYSIVIDAFGSISVYPVPYFVPPVPDGPMNGLELR